MPPLQSSDSSEAEGLEGLVLAERYRVIRLLGEGGMGAVYEAQHNLIDKRVVIKVLHDDMAKDADMVERFRREARAATAIGHENIVDVTDMGELPDGSPFIVMEYLEGQSLAELLHHAGPLTVARTVDIVTQICEALGAAHAKGIVHRDMKPDNVFLVTRKRGGDYVKVLDFGISKVKERGGGDSSLTKTGIAMGTPVYMSPEQAQGLKSLDGRTDVYAVGTMLYEMLAGELPFEADNYPALLLKMMMQPAPTLTTARGDVPSGLAEVVLHAMAKTPDERLASMAQLASALDTYAEIDVEPRLLAAPGNGADESIDGLVPPSYRETEAGSFGPREAELRPDSGPESTAETVVDPLEPAEREPEPAAAVPTQISPPPVRGVPVGAFVLFGLAAAAGAMYYLATRPDEAPPVPPEAPEEVRVRIRVTPADATIRLEGTEFPNPMDALRPRSLDPASLVVESEGYEALQRTVVLDQDRTYDFALARAPLPTGQDVPAPTVEDPPEESPAETRTGRGRRRPTPPEDTSETPGETPIETTEPPETEPADDGVYRGRRGRLRNEF